MFEAVFTIVMGGAVVGAPLVAFVWEHARRKQLHARQQQLAQAEQALVAAGFAVTREIERTGTAPPQATEAYETFTASLRAERGELCTLALGFTHEAASGGARVTGLGVVKRATFVIGREDAVSRAARRAGVKDIEIGDAALDDALRIRGWPADDVRALVAAPGVRAALSRLFADPAAVSVRLAPASSDAPMLGADRTGSIGLRFLVPWDALERIGTLVERLEELARALEDARWVEARSRADRVEPTGATGAASGAPFVVPGSGSR